MGTLKMRIVTLFKRQWCPECKHLDIERVLFSCNANTLEEGLEKSKKILSSEFKPYNKYRPYESFICVNCGYQWTNPEYEKYLMMRNFG